MIADTGGRHRLRMLLFAINLAWALWALTGGWFVVANPELFYGDLSLTLFGQATHGYHLAGYSLIACGVVCLLGMAFNKLRRTGAILCAVWCAAMAGALQIGGSGFGHADVYAWLLLMCSFTCVCQWALLVLEPYVCE